jgi:UDP-glucose 4-epimerase
MRYLVTGGAGFIGSHLTKLLERQGHEVAVLDNMSTGSYKNLSPGSIVYEEDIRDGAAVKGLMRGVQGCFHLAAIASVEECTEKWAESHETNLTGTINVFDAAAQFKVPVVYASSAAVYGNPSRIPVGEHDAKIPLSFYGSDKLGCEQHARAAYTIRGLRSTGLRFFNVYGPGQDPNSPYSGVISIFAKKIMLGDEITIYGDGKQTRDFVYVGDVVLALTVAMARANMHPCTVLNIATGVGTSINVLATLIAKLAEKEVRATRAPQRVGDIQTSVGDPANAAQLLGWKATTSLETGLRATMAALPKMETA